MLSIEGGNLEAMRRLSTRAAGSTATPAAKEIPLGRACSRGRVQTARELIDRGGALAPRWRLRAICAALYGSRNCHDPEGGLGGPSIRTADVIPQRQALCRDRANAARPRAHLGGHPRSLRLRHDAHSRGTRRRPARLTEGTGPTASIHWYADVSDLTPPDQDLDTLAASLRVDASIDVFFSGAWGQARRRHVWGARAQAAGGPVQERAPGHEDHDPSRRGRVRSGAQARVGRLLARSRRARHHFVAGGVPLDVWLRSLVGVLAQQAESSAAASQALRSLVI